MANQFMEKYTEEDYINKCNELNLVYKYKTKEKKKGTIINFICEKHIDKGIQSSDWSHFRTYKKGCKYCTERGKTTDDIRKEIKDKNVEIVSEYIGSEKKIECRCKKCGNVWNTVTKVLTTNGSGCPICGKDKASESRTKSQEKFALDLHIVNPNIKIIGKYKGSHKLIDCKCLICNHEYKTYPSNLLNLSSGCPLCNMSIGERRMLQILDELNINYISQHQIEDCKYIRNLKFDAFDIENNIAFEFNGEQHYKPIDWGSHDITVINKSFEDIKNRDNAKIKYCNDNNIPIIIIPYTEINNMKEYIISELKK